MVSTAYITFLGVDNIHQQSLQKRNSFMKLHFSFQVGITSGCSTFTVKATHIKILRIRRHSKDATTIFVYLDPLRS